MEHPRDIENGRDMDEQASFKDGEYHGTEGVSINVNPYSPDTEEYKRWRWGWVRGIMAWLESLKRIP